MKFKIKLNLRIIGSRLKYLLLFFIFVPPMIVTIIPEVNSLYVLLSYIATVLGVVYLLLEFKYLPKNKVWLSILLFFVWLLVCNIWNSDIVVIRFYFKNILQVLGFTCVICRVNRKRDFKIFFETGNLYVVIIVIFNFISQIFLSEGIYHDYTISWQPYYVCGNGNSFVFFYLFAALIVIFHSMYKIGKIAIEVILFEIILVISMLFADSSTGLVIVVLLLISTILFTKRFFILIKKHYKFVLLTIVAVFTSFIMLNGWKSEWIQNIVWGLLGENISFYARGYIWNNAIHNISNHPVFGYGTESATLSMDSAGVSRSAHNTYLQILLYGGIPALLLFLNIFFRVGDEIKKRKDDSILYGVIVLTLFLIAFLFEQNPLYIGFYASLIIISGSTMERSLN